MKKRKRTKKTRVQNPVKAFIRKVKRAILIMAGLLFVAGLWYAYSSTNDVFSSRAGRVATWSTGALLSPAVEAVPVWFWGLLGAVAVYLWWKHKFIMSILYGLLVGLYFAIGG